jgi:cytochrome c55X
MPIQGHPLLRATRVSRSLWALALFSTLAPAWGSEPVPLDRQRSLVRMVRQDCGSCHGMQLTGGLGPALTPEALKEIPAESVAATIIHGRPGTPMPPWKAMVKEPEARWIAQQLQAGFPSEAPPLKP